MHILGLIFFLAAFLLAMGVVAQLLVANRHRILEALLGNMSSDETTPAAQIYHFPVRERRQIEWREAA